MQLQMTFLSKYAEVGKIFGCIMIKYICLHMTQNCLIALVWCTLGDYFLGNKFNMLLGCRSFFCIIIELYSQNNIFSKRNQSFNSTFLQICITADSALHNISLRDVVVFVKCLSNYLTTNRYVDVH